MPAKRDYVERFWEKVDKRGPDECWEWQAHIIRGTGYGQFWTGVEDTTAHRAAWTITKGPIEDGMYVLHKCDNRRCVNPNHLFIGTAFDNVRDMVRKGRHRNGNARGEEIGNSKLTQNQVAEIINRYTGKHGEQSALAREYGVSQAEIWRIVRRLVWRHVE